MTYINKNKAIMAYLFVKYVSDGSSERAVGVGTRRHMIDDMREAAESTGGAQHRRCTPALFVRDKV